MFDCRGAISLITSRRSDSLCFMGNAEEIIILSDDDDDYLEMSCTEASVIIVETVEEKKTMKDHVLSSGALEEDLVVTYSRRAEVLPHARYDCPIHPFTATDCEVGAPVADNQLFCDQCFCYICDKLVSTCTVWTHSSVCHCNSHKRSDFWNNQRSCTLLGGLKTFNITLSEMDAHLRHAESMLQSFKQELSMKYLAYLKGTVLTTHSPGLENQPLLNYDYTNVYEFVWSFLDQADKQDDRAAAVMRLGAAEEFVKHFQCARCLVSQSPMGYANEAKVVLLRRVVASLQRQLVMSNFVPEFSQSLKNSLCVRLWDDILLGSVLKGQNVTGIRKDKGKKDVLMEQGSIVGLRTELLQRQQRYRELCRYLRVVQTDDPKLFQPLQSLLPFFTCLSGDFTLACNSFFPLVNPPAALLTPELFNVYLRVFETATAPQLLVAQPSELCCTKATWEPIKDAVPLKRAELVRFALRVQTCCPAVSADSSCWIQLLSVVNKPFCSTSSTALSPPDPHFLLQAKDVTNSILTQQPTNIQIPRFFLEVYPDQALLLLVTRALALKILSASLTPALPVLSCFKENVWALWWLWDSLSINRERLNSFLEAVSQEVTITADGGNSLAELLTVLPAVSPPPDLDHTYCSIAAVNFYIAQFNNQWPYQLSS
ncbi:uncharacterized protein LOC103383506 [Cynoglossus semilaevis]|uniref:uncharacterized protein LOC103383506 n=1 Tax=Cynoglossus semilaevis TaxID=244447 RepID=UPI000497437B|nr:uncharacterized protein LOC103383506 [Cynoglossus semilaevis]